MIELGTSLRAARDAKGYTVRQLSEMTRLAPSTIQDLETEDFSRIAAPIYGRGFVKLYCEAIGLDPKPYVDEFMEIYSGNRQTEIRERPNPVSEPTAASTPEPNEIDAEPPIANPILEPKQVHSPEPDLFQQPVQDPPTPPPPEPTLSRYAAPVRQIRPGVDFRVYLRLGILAVGAITLLALLGWGVRSVYRATTRPAEDASSVSEPTESEPTKAKAARTPQKIPSLYID